MNIAYKLNFTPYKPNMGFPGGSVVKNLVANAGDTDSILSLGRSHGDWKGNPLQYSCLENSMDRGTWWPTVHGIAKSWTQLKRQIPWRRKWQPTLVFLPGESHGWRSLVGYTVHGIAMSQTRLSDITSSLDFFLRD